MSAPALRLGGGIPPGREGGMNGGTAPPGKFCWFICVDDERWERKKMIV